MGAIELRELLPFVMRFTEQMDVGQLGIVPHEGTYSIPPFVLSVLEWEKLMRGGSEVDFLMKQLYRLGRLSTQVRFDYFVRVGMES